jgi:hypothetical protein
LYGSPVRRWISVFVFVGVILYFWLWVFDRFRARALRRIPDWVIHWIRYLSLLSNLLCTILCLTWFELLFSLRHCWWRMSYRWALRFWRSISKWLWSDTAHSRSRPRALLLQCWGTTHLFSNSYHFFLIELFLIAVRLASRRRWSRFPRWTLTVNRFLLSVSLVLYPSQLRYTFISEMLSCLFFYFFGFLSVWVFGSGCSVC